MRKRTSAFSVRKDGVSQTRAMIAYLVVMDVICATLFHLTAKTTGVYVKVPVEMAVSIAILIEYANNAPKIKLSSKDNASPVVTNVANAKCFKRVGQVN